MSHRDVSMCWGIQENPSPSKVEVNEMCDASFQRQRTHEDLESGTHEVSESRMRSGLDSQTLDVSELRTRHGSES
jgi:hypothetical protein